MKRMVKYLIAIFVVIGVLMGSVSCSRNIEDYKDYCCYDYHLRFLNASNGIGKYKFESEENDTTYTLEYKKIIGENQTEIIGATVSATLGWLSSSCDRVLQSPQTYVSIIDEWTIEKIQFYVYDITKAEEQNIIFESSDSDDIEAFRSFRSLEDHFTFDIDSARTDGYEREFSIYENEKRLNLRIVFSESENIVWETEIQSYFNPSTYERIFAIDLGQSNDDKYGYYSEDGGWKKVDDSMLNQLFTEFIIQIDSNS